MTSSGTAFEPQVWIKCRSFPRKRESRAKNWIPAFAGTSGDRSATLKSLALALVIGAATLLLPAPARAETVLGIAMTAGDIPDWTGQPDQGFEGYRFVGFALYDGLVNWDLSRSDREADIKPALATKWSADPGDLKKWIIELRHDVKFHDGCDWNADAAVWNFERLTSKASPAFSPLHFARARSRSNDIDRVE